MLCRMDKPKGFRYLVYIIIWYKDQIWEVGLILRGFFEERVLTVICLVWNWCDTHFAFYGLHGNAKFWPVAREVPEWVAGYISSSWLVKILRFAKLDDNLFSHSLISHFIRLIIFPNVDLFWRCTWSNGPILSIFAPNLSLTQILGIAKFEHNWMILSCSIR